MKPVPTFEELQASIKNELVSRLGLADGDELKKVVDAFSAVEAGKLKLLYLYFVDVLNNWFPDTADLAEDGGQLERIGSIYLNRQPNAATQGKYTVSVTGEAASVLRASLTFKSDDSAKNPGVLYVLDSEVVLTGANDTIEIRSLDSGIAASLAINDTLTITEPVIGVEQTVTVTAVVEEPRAAESIESYRRAILDSIQLEPQGGARTDYRIWALDAQGVRKVYPYVKEGEAGTVQIYVEATTEDSLDAYGTPTAQLLLDVEAVINQDPDESKPINERGRRPLQATIETSPIVITPVDITITGLNESTTAIQTAIQTAIEQFLYSVRPYIDGSDLLRDKNDTLYLAKLQSAISDTLESSNYFTGFSMDVEGNTVNSFQFVREKIPYLRNLNFN